MIRFVYLQDPRATFFLGGGLGEKDMLTLGIPRCLKFSFFGQQTKNSIPPLAILRTWPFWDGEWVHVTFWKGWLFATNPTNLGIKSGHSLNHPDDHYDCHYYYDDDDYYYHYHYYHHFMIHDLASPSYFVSLLFSWMLSLDSVFLALSFSFSWFLSSIYRYLVYISNIHKLKKKHFFPQKKSPQKIRANPNRRFVSRGRRPMTSDRTVPWRDPPEPQRWYEGVPCRSPTDGFSTVGAGSCLGWSKGDRNQ